MQLIIKSTAAEGSGVTKVVNQARRWNDPDDKTTITWQKVSICS